jgi:hypothetical protein
MQYAYYMALMMEAFAALGLAFGEEVQDSNRSSK